MTDHKKGSLSCSSCNKYGINSVLSKRNGKELGEGILSKKKRKINNVELCDTERDYEIKDHALCDTERDYEVKDHALCDTERDYEVKDNELCDTEGDDDAKDNELCDTDRDYETKDNELCDTERDYVVKDNELCDTERDYEIKDNELCDMEGDDDAKDNEYLPFQEDEYDVNKGDDEAKEAFIQFGDTNDLAHLLLGVVKEDKSSHVAKCFQDETKDKCFQDDDEAKETFIQIGDTVNLSDLLFTKYRDFLISFHQNTYKLAKVKAKDLAGKFVLLHFMYLRDFFDTWSWKAPIANLEDIYTKLHPKGDFEIVFVALRDDGEIPSNIRQCLQHIFSMMPCPAIPCSDQKSIHRLERMFGIHNTKQYGPKSFIIDPTGVVLQSHATPLLLSYGAAAYPFTNERIQFLDSEDSLFRTQPLSVEKLLSSPDRDYLINNKGDQVPLHNLDDKVVGLYFCPCLDGVSTTRKLEVVYQELSQKMEDFEIVLIYSHGWCEHEDTCSLVDEDSFLHIIKTMPWLALPFTDTNCIKKLQRVLQYPQRLDSKPEARLVIIGPHGEFLEPLGTQILSTYGAPAYPFTLLSAVNLVLETAKNMKPEMLWELEAIFTQSIGSQVRFSQFVGKRIIVFYETYENQNWVSSNALRELKARYLEMKGTEDEFEVIHIVRGKMFSTGIKAPVPWLMHPPFDEDTSEDKFMRCMFGNKTGLLAFDADGSVIRVTTFPQLGDKKSFPFYHNENMENEVLLDVKKKISFRLERVYKGYALFGSD